VILCTLQQLSLGWYGVANADSSGGPSIRCGFGEIFSILICALASHPTYGRYLKTGADNKPKIDKSKIVAEEKFDGVLKP